MRQVEDRRPSGRVRLRAPGPGNRCASRAGVGDRAGIRFVLPGQDAQQGGLAAAVGSDQPAALAGAEAEGDVFENRLDAVGFGNVMCSQHGTPVKDKRKTGADVPG